MFIRYGGLFGVLFCLFCVYLLTCIYIGFNSSSLNGSLGLACTITYTLDLTAWLLNDFLCWC